MSVKIIYDYYINSEFTDTSKAQGFIPQKNIIVKYIHTYIACVNDPTFTSINLKIYANRAGMPGKLLFTSTDVRTKAEILTDNSCIGWFYFTFDNVELRKDETYFLVMNATGYTGSDTSNVGWAKAWPDIVYDQSTPVTSVSAAYDQFGFLISTNGNEL